MSEDGHCEHCCGRHCPHSKAWSHVAHSDGEGVRWMSQCPYCAEREQIVAALRAYADNLYPARKSWKPGDAIAFAALELDVAADWIERGTHLEVL